MPLMPPMIKPSKPEKPSKPGNWLVIYNSSTATYQAGLISALQQAGIQATMLEMSEKNLSNTRILAFQHLQHNWPEVILDITGCHLHPSECSPQLHWEQLLGLFQAMGELGNLSPCRMFVLLSGVWQLGAEEIYPEQSLLLGLLAAWNRENSTIQAYAIDIGWCHDHTPWDWLIQQWQHTDVPLPMAYRGHRAWSRIWKVADLTPATLPRLQRQGFYIITGGLSGIGLVLARYLSNGYEAKLLLIGQTKLPDPSAWDAWLRTHSIEDVVSQKIVALKDMQRQNPFVVYESVDVADKQMLQDAIQKTQRMFGQESVTGVIHAAGIAGGGLIQLKTMEQARAVWKPKVMGLFNLLEIFQKIKLDWLLLCSSESGISGTPGQSDYQAANAVFDAVADASDMAAFPIIAIHWSTWKETGMALHTQVSSWLEPIRQANLAQGITDEEGIQVFQRIMESGIANVAVSPYALLKRHTINLAEVPEFSRVSPATPSIQSQPTLQQDILAQQDTKQMAISKADIELAMVQIWQDILGKERIQPQDDFLELGGDSLLAIQVLSQIAAQFDVQIGLAKFFQNSTITALTKSIYEQIKEAKK